MECKELFRVHMLAAFSKTSAIDLGGSATYSVQHCNKADAIMVQCSQEVALLYSFSYQPGLGQVECVYMTLAAGTISPATEQEWKFCSQTLFVTPSLQGPYLKS